MRFLPKNRQHSSITNATRRVGFELEFAGLDLEEVADALVESLSGTVKPETRAECTVSTQDLGDFKVELDWQQGKLLAEDRLQTLREETGEEHPEDPLMDWITTTASQIVPMEVVCPPVPADRLDELVPMVEMLRDKGAIGTRGSPIYAFGVHINPELPDDSAATVAAYLKAFCVTQDWLIRKHEVDLSRRITPYIDIYPKQYIHDVLAYTDEVTMDEIITDYLKHNPTRNRALDMTPLFKYLDETRIERELADDRINARPTFHYRLPNCHIEQADWSLMDSWSIWCVLEHLVADPEKLNTMQDLWRQQDQSITLFDTPEWHEQLDEIHNDLLSA